MKTAYWTIRKYEGGFSLSVCCDSNFEGLRVGHDQCGVFPSVEEAVWAAFHDELSAPENTENEMTDEARIAKSVARINAELATSDEAELRYPLAAKSNNSGVG